MLSFLTATAAQRGFSACFMAEFSSSHGDFGSSCCHHYRNTPWGLPPGDSEEEEGGKQELGALRCQPVLCLLQFRVLEKSTEFTISDLFWVTEYCLSVEPSMANRRVPTTRTDEQCVTTGHRDSKCDAGKGGIRGCRSPPASWPWGRGDPCQGSLSVLCALRNPPLPPHLVTPSLAGSAGLLPGILSSCFIILLLLGLLGALLARTYIRKPVRTPSALVRQGQCRGTLCGQSKAAGLGSAARGGHQPGVKRSSLPLSLPPRSPS